MTDLRLRDTPLAGVRWSPGEAARLGYIQPAFEFDATTSTSQVLTNSAPAVDLLRLTLHEERRFEPPTKAPTLVLLPELSIPADEIATVQQMVAEAAKNTVVVFGLTPLTEAQVAALEPEVAKDNALWAGPAEQRRTNCAAVVVGGDRSVYLQPKILASRWELDTPVARPPAITTALRTLCCFRWHRVT
jgi:hypothetical protein